MKISIVIPIYNEAESLENLYDNIIKAAISLGCWYEIIFVDDGSTDKTPFVLQDLYGRDQKKVRLIRFLRNRGQTHALLAGFKASRGDIIVTLDADLQNDPADMNMFIDKINEGYDFVCGWRFKRNDNFMKIILSCIFNWFLRTMLKTGLHDISCGFKTFKKEVIDNLDLNNGEHRFIPILIDRKTFKATEIKIRHYKRKFGKSKYPILRFVAFFDILKIIFSRRL